MAKTVDVSAEEIRSCACAFANWLDSRGFCFALNATEEFSSPLERVFLTLDHVRVDEDGGPALVVRHVLWWLCMRVLPSIDDGREIDRARVSGQAPSDLMPDPKAFAELKFGLLDDRLARRLRKLLAKAADLEPDIARVAARQRARDGLVGGRADRGLAAVYHHWMVFGAILRAVAEPSGFPIPRTKQAWKDCVGQLELRLFDAGLRGEAIAELFPGTRAEQLPQRRCRARQRA